MKNHFSNVVILFTCWYLSISFAQDQRYATVSVEEFTRELNNNWDGSYHQQKIRAALFTQRPDLIKACYENERTQGYIDGELIKFPDGPEKDAILLMILRTRDERWRSFAFPYMGPRPITPQLREPFSSFIRKYLPENSLNDDQIINRESRLALCDRLEAAMTGQPIPPKKTPPQSSPIPQKESSRPDSIDKMALANTPTASDENLPGSTLWVVVAIAFTISSLAWWFLKKRK